MPEIEIRRMDETTEYFVSTCSHVNESDELDAAGRRRLAWLREMEPKGLQVFTALCDGEPVGFAYLMPVELSPWGPVGRDLMVMPCVWVLPKSQKQGAGTALVLAAEEAARETGRKALVTFAYEWDFWFMPAEFFRKRGFTEAARQGKAVTMWRQFHGEAEPPQSPKRRYDFAPVSGKVVVDLFYNTFCQTSAVEAQRVREVAAELGDRVVLNENSVDNLADVTAYGVSRAIFLNGREVSWGYEAPKDELRAEIEKELKDD